MEKLRHDQRDLELKRKREREEIDRLREEELLKIRKEKRALELRAKTLQESQNGQGRIGTRSRQQQEDQRTIETLKR